MRKTKNNYVPAEYGGYLFPKSCLPEIIEGDRGKVLTVNETETGVEWANCLPEIMYGDAGKVLTVNESETGLEWAEGGGGGMLVHVNLVYDDESGSYVSGVLDKTWKEIHDAFIAGMAVSFLFIEYDIITPFNMESMGYDPVGGYSILLYSTIFMESTLFATNTQTGYPSFEVIDG